MTTQPEKPWLIVRLDDVRGRCKKQDRVCDLLEEYGAPIHLEVIPEDLDEIGATDLREENSRRSVAVLCHQHGYRHFNHGTDGRRCEFGDHRGFENQFEDLGAGKEQLATLLGETFEPIFSPPWNRYGKTTLDAAKAAGLQGMSVLWKEGGDTHPQFPIIPFTLDPVRWKPTPVHQPWQRTLEELLESMEEEGSAGLQLHHEVMETDDFDGLKNTLAELVKNGVQFPPMGDLLVGWRGS